MEQASLDVEWVATGELQPNPANPRKNEAAVPHVAASLARFGWRQPIVARPSGELVAGHTRLLAARSLDMESVPVVRFEGSDLEATAYAIADNRTHEFAEWDQAGLAQLLDELRSEDALEGVGFTGSEIDELLAELAAEAAAATELDDPGPEEPPEDPTTQVGDVWLLGEHHRLICGDSTDPAVLAELMQGERASLVWTDPPYGVSYIGGTKDEMTIENDDLDLADLESLLEGAFGSAADACEPGAVWYVAAPAGPNFLPFAKRLSELGIWRQTLVWEKDSLVLGRSDYHYRHEAILYGWVPGAAHHAPKTRALDTILKFARPKSSPDHPTMKPVPLVQHCIETSSKPGGIILDPFSGSGTTLLAAESCARKARCIELDPRYCDVIVRRFEEATGKGTTLEGSDLSFADVATQRGAS